jgi:hypothetical protein
MNDEELAAEHARLKAQTEALQREHERLQSSPDPDLSRHAEHREQLRRKIAELNAHMARLLARRPPDTTS